MKKSLVLLVLLGIALTLKAQIAPDKYWVQFTDKNNTSYSIDNPHDFLSERAIQRRINYGIAIDEYDIPVNQSYLDAVADKGAVLLNPSKWLNGVSVMVENASVLQSIESLPFVQNVRCLYDDEVKHNIKKKLYFEEGNPVDVAASKNSSYYGLAERQIAQLNGVELHNMGYQGQGMWIGVCDGGFVDVDTHDVFADMRDSGRLLGTRDYVYKNGIVYSDSYHGTSCLSLMAGNIPNEYVGTAPLASYYLCRTEDVNSENVIEEYNWVSAAEFLDSLGVDVISTSLGYLAFDMPQWTHLYEDLDGETCVITIGSEIASSKGILCVNSAGNDGANEFPYISAPADGANVFTIGAVGDNGARAYFSSVGPTYDGRIKPDVMAHGYNTTVASPGGNYYEGSGTSFACPVLAGMLTCLWQADRTATPDEIKDVLRQNANNSANPDNEYGYGIPDFMSALDMLSINENQDMEANSLISVYPNPAKDEVKVKLYTEAEITVQLYSQLGRLLYTENIQNSDISVIESVFSGLGKGVYFVHIVGSDEIQTIKLIKY